TLAIEINGAVHTLAAQAGITSFKIPLALGKPTFRLVRNGRLSINMTGPWEIKRELKTQDFLYRLGSSSRPFVPFLSNDRTPMAVCAPPTGLTCTPVGRTVQLRWTPSPDAVSGYRVYRASDPAGPYTLLSPNSVTATTYTDPTPPKSATYLVSAVKVAEQQEPVESEKLLVNYTR
ncbi:MAG TPA: fibronectin type III domain-containing protein, partial [Armatimonadota bacterium]